MSATALTLFDKLWQRHLVDVTEDGEALLYIDRHLVYEVTSPQAFEDLRAAAAAAIAGHFTDLPAAAT